MIYIIAVVLLFALLHYSVLTSAPLTQLNITIPVSGHNKNTIVETSNISSRPVNTNITNTNIPYRVTFEKSRSNSLRRRDWLQGILAAILGVLATISLFIKFLLDLTIIRIPQPQINEANVNERAVYVNPLNMVIVVVLSLAVAIIIILSLTRLRVKLGRYYVPRLGRERISVEPLEKIDYNLDFKDLRTAIISSFRYLYFLSLEKLGLSEARTPREVALELDKIGLADEAWLIVSAFEELKYGKRIPKWITLKDLREAVRNIEGKILQWSNQ